MRIESWDDIVSRPGFLATVDPKAVKLKEIIGSYSFDTFIPCGLSTCHLPHGTGFLVVTDSGNETSIGPGARLAESVAAMATQTSPRRDRVGGGSAAG